jgi:thiamine-phosphate pyrophosphorylase
MARVWCAVSLPRDNPRCHHPAVFAPNTLPSHSNREPAVAKTKTKSNSKPPASDIDWPACQLMLTVQPGPGALAALRAAFGHCQPAAVLIRPKPEHNLGAGEVKPLVDFAQEYGAAAIIFEDVRLARTLRADGVHFDRTSDGALSDLIADARASLGAAANIGADAGISRHRAMEAGEAGADYVAFGAAEATAVARQARNDLISWWAGIFEIPCVALDVATADEAEACCADGADFVALTLLAGASEDAIMRLAGDVDRVLNDGYDAGREQRSEQT